MEKSKVDEKKFFVLGILYEMLEKMRKEKKKV